MPVETIECQIVQGQLGRYLSGDPLPTEAVRELERHIGGCPICRAEVATRRATLHALLGVAPTPEASEANPLLDLLRQRSSSTETVPTHAVTPHLSEPAPSVETDTAPAPRRLFTKPILLSASLAIVLIVMNFLTDGPTDLLGPRADKPTATPKTTIITTAAATTADDRLFRAEWESFAVSDLADFDADLTDALPAWRWFGLDAWTEAPVPEAVEEAVEEPELDAIEAWEVFGISEQLLTEPDPAPAPVQATPTRPRVNRPAAARPQPTQPSARPTPPAPTEPQIRVYPPES